MSALAVKPQPKFGWPPPDYDPQQAENDEGTNSPELMSGAFDNDIERDHSNERTGPAVAVESPVVNGQQYVMGSTLTASRGTWSNGARAFKYRWLNDGVPIIGASSSSYTITAGDIGCTLAVTVTATNAVGSTSITSANTPVITSGSVTFSTPQQRFNANIDVSPSERLRINLENRDWLLDLDPNSNQYWEERLLNGPFTTSRDLNTNLTHLHKKPITRYQGAFGIQKSATALMNENCKFSDWSGRALIAMEESGARSAAPIGFKECLSWKESGRHKGDGTMVFVV
jgi:hypothetical protein